MSDGKDRLKQLRKALNLSQPEFAESIGIPVTTVNSIEGGKQKLSVRVALALQNKIIKDKYENILLLNETRQKKADDAELRIEWLVAGIGEPFDSVIKNSDVFVIKLTNGSEVKLPIGENIKFFNVMDDSMSPEFAAKDIIAIDTNLFEISNGALFMVEYEKSMLLRKVYKIDKNKFNLVAINEKVMPPVEVHAGEIRVIGKYVYKIGFDEDF